jgi:lipooligosaccharide transport system ATP-binding protein
MENTCVFAKNVSKTFGSLKAVDRLSFTVKPARCFGFLGPNGAGKTTMMKMLYGRAIRDPDPDSRISVFGYDPASDELAIKTVSGVVPQENNLDDDLNVIQNLNIFSKFYHIPHRIAKKRIQELLEFMELSDKKKALIRELSGGMKRRLVIARSLINNPRLLILDEPTTGLDPQVRHLIWDRIRDLKKQGITVLLTTHYMEEAFQISDRIIIMDQGEKIMEGNPQKLLEDNIEPFVLEVTDPSSLDGRIGKLPEGVKRDDTGSQVRFFSCRRKDLQKIAQLLQPGEYFMRPSNLEDLFLKITGRALNVRQ